MTTLEKIRAEIAENQKVISETLSFDKENEFYNGKWAGFELALAIIDRYASEECTNDCEHCVYLECPKEPCEDAVSRQAVLDLLLIVTRDNFTLQDYYEKVLEFATEIQDRIEQLPSVQPKGGAE